MSAKPLFAQLTKVDEKTRTVFGRMVQEVPDHSGEIFDYETSKPYFKAWVEKTKSASGGKSLGNVRAMHGATAAGKITGIEFVDAEKAMDIAAKVVDDQEWRKVLEGVYTGFSIGGKYLGDKWADGDFKRYTAVPSEVSLVDAPCVPTSTFFSVHKADGSVIEKAFKPFVAADDKKKEALAAAEDEGNKVSTAKEDADAEDAKARGVGEGDGNKEHPEPDGDEGKQTPPGGDEADDDTKAKGKKEVPAAEKSEPSEFEVEGSEEDVAALHKAMTDHDLSVSEVTSMVGDVFDLNLGKLFEVSAAKATFADTANRRFPLDTEAQVKAAAYYVNTAAAKALYDDDTYAVVKSAVEEAWKAKVSPDLPEDVSKAVTEDDLAKSFYASSQFCSVLDTLQYLCQSAAYQYADGARADLAVKCKKAVWDLASCVVEMVSADANALKDDPTTQTLAAKADALLEVAKLDEASLAKIGARNSGPDAKRIQTIHDLSVQLGAKSPKVNPNGVIEEPAKALDAEDLTKALDAAINKAVAPLLQEIELLKAQPTRPRAVLRAVNKTQDLGADGLGAGTQIDPVRKADGQVDEVATDIKSLHKSGGVPLFVR